MQWMPLESEEDWEKVLQDSQSEDIWVLKHSPSCGISHAVRNRLFGKLNGAKQPAGRYQVNVLSSRQLSNRIASDLSVRHESPQFLLIRESKVVWHASHYDILDFEPVRV